jgi:hypothetical protein
VVQSLDRHVPSITETVTSFPDLNPDPIHVIRGPDLWLLGRVIS